MPHYKCLACKARLYSASSPTDLVGDLCPGCGALLEPVGDLAEVVGFQSITLRDGAGDDETAGPHQQIPLRIDDFLARREEILARSRIDAECWLDDDGGFRAQAVALPPPETNT